MTKPDRLSALIARFELHAELTEHIAMANLLIHIDPATKSLSYIEFWPTINDDNLRTAVNHGNVIAASIRLGGEANPLVRALPAPMTVQLACHSEEQAIAQLIRGEVNGLRCGRHSTLRRLFEVLSVMLLRRAIKEHVGETGLIAGLADHRICKAIVAIHDRPEFDWRIEDLADTAGLSRSQFMDRFKRCVGQTPAQYLREWRLTLAKQDLEQGERVKSVAARYGYRSHEALSRAFNQRYCLTPAQVRKVHLEETKMAKKHQ